MGTGIKLSIIANTFHCRYSFSVFHVRLPPPLNMNHL